MAIQSSLKAAALLTLGLLAPAAQATTTLQLNPANGVLPGNPGASVGWGFTLTNDANYLVVTSANFVPISPLGTFTDFIAQFNLFVLGPPPEVTTETQPQILPLQLGIGSFAISPSAFPGQSANGSIVLTYDLFSVSPNDPGFNPVTDTISTDNLLTANASVVVTGSGAQVVPTLSPVGLALLGALLAGLAVAVLRRRRA